MSKTKNYFVEEPHSVYKYLEDNEDKINVGDIIEYISNNQLGYVKYEVVLENRKKI